MRLRQAVAGLRNAEIAIARVGAQTIGFEILVAIVTDGDALFRPRARSCGRQPPRLGLAIRLAICLAIRLAILGLDMFSRGGFGSGFASALARGRLFQRGGLRRSARFRLLLGHRRSPFPFDAEKVSTNRNSWGGLSASEPTIQRRTELVDQCSRNTPSTARNSAGLISLE